MKSLLILVGKTTNKHFAAGIKDYTERIGHYMPFEIITIPEIKNTKSLSEEQQKDRDTKTAASLRYAGAPGRTWSRVAKHRTGPMARKATADIAPLGVCDRWPLRFLSRCLSTSQRQAEPLAAYLLAPDGASGIYRTALSCLHYNKR